MEEIMQIVLMGALGSGKTTLYNRITNSNEKVVSGGKSCTQNVYLKLAAYGQVPFKVLDTPGFGAYSKRIDHAAAVVAALTEGPITRILIAVKFERTEHMRKYVLQVLAPVTKYRNLVTLVVTHWDLSENPDFNQSEIEEVFKKLNIHSYIYCAKNETGEQTCQKIIQELTKSKPEAIELLLTEQASSFDLAEFEDELELNVLESKENLKVMFRGKFLALKTFIEQTPAQTKNLADLMHVVSLEVKKQAEEVLKIFEKDNWEFCNQAVDKGGNNCVFLLHVLLKKELEDDIKFIVKLAQLKMTESGNHYLQNIRKCNFCGKIWMKVQGCGGYTICGAVPDKKEIIQYSAPQEWDLTWKKDDKTKKIEVQITLRNSQQSQQGTQEYKKVNGRQIFSIKNGEKILEQYGEQYEIGAGCGQVIDWAKMKPLNEAELEELRDSGIMDYLNIEDKKISQELKQAQQPFEKQLKLAVQNQKSNIIRR